MITGSQTASNDSTNSLPESLSNVLNEAAAYLPEDVLGTVQEKANEAKDFALSAYEDPKGTWESLKDMLSNNKELAIGGTAAAFGLAVGGPGSAVLLGGLAMGIQSIMAGDLQNGATYILGAFAGKAALEGDLGSAAVFGAATAAAKTFIPDGMSGQDAVNQVSSMLTPK